MRSRGKWVWARRRSTVAKVSPIATWSMTGTGRATMARKDPLVNKARPDAVGLRRATAAIRWRSAARPVADSKEYWALSPAAAWATRRYSRRMSRLVRAGPGVVVSSTDADGPRRADCSLASSAPLSGVVVSVIRAVRDAGIGFLFQSSLAPANTTALDTARSWDGDGVGSPVALLHALSTGIRHDLQNHRLSCTLRRPWKEAEPMMIWAAAGLTWMLVAVAAPGRSTVWAGPGPAGRGPGVGKASSGRVMMAATVLVVEDEVKIRELLRSYLEAAGFEVLSTGSGAEAIGLARTAKPDLMVPDLRLPDVSGESVASEVRSASAVPILILTAKSSEHERILGLELGADDYVTKPFSPREVVLRAQAILRRGAPGAEVGGPRSFGRRGWSSTKNATRPRCGARRWI